MNSIKSANEPQFMHYGHLEANVKKDHSREVDMSYITFSSIYDVFFLY